MLQRMRKYTKSWISSLFLGGLALSFGLWGIADIFQGRTDTSVAKIGSTEISASDYQLEYREMLRNETNPDGTPVTTEQARARGLPQRALETLLTRLAIDREAARLKLAVSDDTISAAIRAIPAFTGPTGTFDHTTFLTVIDRLGYSEPQFIERMRADSVRQQLLGPFGSGFVMPPGYARALFSYLNEVRAVEYVELSPQVSGAVPQPTDTDLQAYEKANAGRFSTPEYRKITYVSIGPDDVMAKVKVTDAQLRQAYDERQSIYQVPEKRDVQQIVFPDDKSAASARARIEAGASVTDIAKERNQTEKDIDLGTVAKADLGKERGDAAFALPVNGTSQPVKFAFGWALLHVSKISPGVNRSLDEVKPELLKDIAAQLAQAQIVDILNKFEDERGGGAELAQAGEKVGMHVVHVAATDAHGMASDTERANVPQDPDFYKQVFATEAGEEGDAFQVKDGHTYVLKVEGVTPPRLRPLDSIRAQLTAAWQSDEMRKRLDSKAKELAAIANKSGNLSAVASQTGLSTKQSGGLRRGEKQGPLSDALLASIFKAKPGTTVYGISQDKTGYVIAQITGVSHPKIDERDPRYRGGVSQLSREVAQDFTVGLALDERQRAGVVINQKMLDTVAGGGS